MSWQCRDDVETFKMKYCRSTLVSQNCCLVLIVSADVVTLS